MNNTVNGSKKATLMEGCGRIYQQAVSVLSARSLSQEDSLLVSLIEYVIKKSRITGRKRWILYGFARKLKERGLNEQLRWAAEEYRENGGKLIYTVNEPDKSSDSCMSNVAKTLCDIVLGNINHIKEERLSTQSRYYCLSFVAAHQPEIENLQIQSSFFLAFRDLANCRSTANHTPSGLSAEASAIVRKIA